MAKFTKKNRRTDVDIDVMSGCHFVARACNGEIKLQIIQHLSENGVLAVPDHVLSLSRDDAFSLLADLADGLRKIKDTP